ncbi:PEP-CTERM sorting domain-containing protein [Massilia scottii]|uniref:PEP-CTERM sorting domain-containing protein n=1 Tax=Massilia scottii TaxID=3057166 RepID=UPI0027965CA7|nr:PEP-CTERM sorting domain-containing protein [Massilia sp. CCM 9029]MDQ1829227.1 PEP-CTERM sorting domain-containing protein [Massilia sp. CCM 9029]
MLKKLLCGAAMMACTMSAHAEGKVFDFSYQNLFQDYRDVTDVLKGQFSVEDKNGDGVYSVSELIAFEFADRATTYYTGISGERYGFTSWSTGGGAPYYTYYEWTNDTQFTVTAVPEPQTYMMFGAGLLALAAAARLPRRRSRADPASRKRNRAQSALNKPHASRRCHQTAATAGHDLITISQENPMSTTNNAQRRLLLQAAAGIGAACQLGLGNAAPAVAPPASGKPGDVDFLAGEWTIRHQQLKEKNWESFEGEATVIGMLGGLAGVEELRIPARSFSGMGLRILDVEKSCGRTTGATKRTGCSIRPRGAVSPTASAPGTAPISTTAKRSSRAACGTGSRRIHAAGTRPSRAMAAPPGKRTGSWIGNGPRFGCRERRHDLAEFAMLA